MRIRHILTASLFGAAVSGLHAPAWWEELFRFRSEMERRTVFIEAGSFTMGSREAGPAAPPREMHVDAFRIGRCEVTVGEFVEYLNTAGVNVGTGTPQVVRRRGSYRSQRATRRKPVAHVSYGEAAAYCEWLSGVWGCRVRLPTEEEWERAARAGIKRARYPWGWGDPAGRACFGASGPRRVGSYEPNAFGLYDMAGNVFEWCMAGEFAPEDKATARGGSWAERDARMLRVFHREWFPRDYRDADVGFRIVVESGD